DVSISRRSHDTFSRRHRRLVEHDVDQPLLDLSRVVRLPRPDAEQVVGCLVRTGAQIVVIVVEAPAVLPTVAFGLDHRLDPIRPPKARCLPSPALAPTSIPTSSSSVMGPTGNPNLVIRRSITSIGTPSRSRNPASFM